MQFNNSTALVSALVSAIIGFGLAFYFERKLSNSMQKKSQKILTSLAMISFGYGLMATLNEVVGLPMQGLQTRYDKLMMHVIVNILFFPIIFVVIAKLIGLNNKEREVDVVVQSNSVAGGFFKYFLILVCALLVAYLGYLATQSNKEMQNNKSIPVYDLYIKGDNQSCSSDFDAKRDATFKFVLKEKTREVLIIGEYYDNNNGKSDRSITTLENCNVIDERNWTCGGTVYGSLISDKYTFIDGKFYFQKGNSSLLGKCPVKWVKR